MEQKLVKNNPDVKFFSSSIGGIFSNNKKLIILVIIAVVILSVFLNSKNVNQVNENQAWVNVVSPDEKLSVDLPKSFEFNNTPNGYNWMAKDQNNKVGYVIKYQDYNDIFLKLNMEELSSTGKNTFLQSLADDVKKAPEYNVSNFSTEFVNIKGYNAIKYTGFISGADGSSNLEGYIILVGKSSYHISVLYVTGANNEINRVLNSLIIK